MFSFKGVFSSSARDSELQAAITFEDASRVYKTVSEPGLRVPAAISITILKMAHNFSEGLLRMEGEFSKKIGDQNHRKQYDVVAFEAAAFAHWWSMKEYRLADSTGANDVDDDGEYAMDDSIRIRDEALISSALLSGQFCDLQRYLAGFLQRFLSPAVSGSSSCRAGCTPDV